MDFGNHKEREARREQLQKNLNVLIGQREALEQQIMRLGLEIQTLNNLDLLEEAVGGKRLVPQQ